MEKASGVNASDWTSFDVSKSLRLLRVGDEAQVKKELRKLHLRWWHAHRAAMERILRAAGVPGSVLQHIPHIINTCRECRVWVSPGPSVTPSIHIVTSINDEVEADILFYKQYMA